MTVAAFTGPDGDATSRFAASHSRRRSRLPMPMLFAVLGGFAVMFHPSQWHATRGTPYMYRLQTRSCA